MTTQEWIDHCKSKPGSLETRPFGELPLVFKVCGKIFAELYPVPGNNRISLKCEPMLADLYRTQFPGAVVRGYHCPRALWPYWNTVYFDKVPHELIIKMIDHSYAEVVKKLPKSQRLNLLNHE
jgi:predicted DNA-binding protein (MmcQ/YjbR family)